MKERPIIFNSQVIRAILDGCKTQTRRLLNPQPHLGITSVEWRDDIVIGINHPHISGFTMMRNGIIESYPIRFPFGVVGDRLWVRETFFWNYEYEKREFCKTPDFCFYRTDGEISDQVEDSESFDKWIPSIHMPRWASRINLNITNIRIERLKDISEDDAIKEGIGHGFQMNAGYPDYCSIKNGACTLTQDTAVMSYSTLWDSIYGKKLSWQSNPWVWVIEFERIL